MDNFDIAFNTYYQRRYFESHFVHDIKYMFDYIQYIVRRDLMKNTWKDLASEKMAREKLKLGEENFFEKVLKVRKWSADNSLSLRLNPSQRHALELRRLFEEYANGSSAKIIYNYGKNRIEVPTGILQKAFFKGNRPQSLNWGAIGSLIAQEVTNAFYYEGQYYDSRGNGVEWWRPEVTEDFKNKESCFREQYLEYLQNDYGTNLEEDLTDLPPQYVTATAGLKAAYLTYNFSMTSQENEFLPGLVYTPNQLFWISAAQVMCENPSKENVEERLLNRTYVPAKFKVIGAVSNLPQFAQDFNCPSGAPMNPERKCKLW
ncbi:neprilysin-2-like isoform X2 [Stegodyphus dumicola]|uniref:neprilysin-2-like isoform X2 n=1 Tax=Stegodyphus dumicola TaxID=202533 RepID=UPI0015B18557|nr:neprilysin-2-like isoform X2 [Stegodyphus dumicola]